tara:strand:+ start:164 stop:484 length:321 start_codon:yes stop_codon:yes gene_type:complete
MYYDKKLHQEVKESIKLYNSKEKINKIVKSLKQKTSSVDITPVYFREKKRELIKYEDERILLMFQILETFNRKFENNWVMVTKIEWILRNRNNLDILVNDKGQLNI